MTALRHINLELGIRVRQQGREYAFAGEVTREGAPLAAERDLSFKDLRTAAYVTLTRADFDALYAQAEIRILRLTRRAPGAANPLQKRRRSPGGAGSGARPTTPRPARSRIAALSDFVTEHVACVDSVRPPPSAAALRTCCASAGRRVTDALPSWPTDAAAVSSLCVWTRSPPAC